MSHLSWITYTELTEWRSECFKRFGSVLDIKVVPSAYSEIKSLYREGKVLDVGAGKEKMLQRELRLEDKEYFTLDSDLSGVFNYSSFADIPEEMKFDYVVMNQFLEHLNLNDIYEMLKNSHRVMASGGCLFISIPNAAHPVRYHGTITHITNLPFNELYVLLQHVGFVVSDVLRANKRPFPTNIVKRWIIDLVCKEFRMDWCDTIIMVAKKA